jgi:hypothetical protein
LWRFAEVWQNPRRKNALVFSLSLAGALLSKFTASILFFAFVAFCSEHALARCAWPAHCQTRGACLAPASLARHSSGHSLGCPYRLPTGLFCSVPLGMGLRKSEEALPDSPYRAISKNGGVLPAASGCDRQRCIATGKVLRPALRDQRPASRVTCTARTRQGLRF